MKDPSRTSPSSSQARWHSVNAEAPRRMLFGRRRFVRIEMGIRSYRPAPRSAPPPPPEPARADEVLAALAELYPPGTPINATAIMAAGGVHRERANAIRRWAKHAGRWPYREPITGFAKWHGRQGGEP